MPRLVSSCLSIFWLTVFVFKASDLLLPAAQGQVAAFLSATSHMLAATLFFCLLLATSNAEAVQTGRTLRAAIAMAVFSASLDAAFSADGGTAALFMQVAALGMTYVVVCMEATGRPIQATGSERTLPMARHLARAAGHRATMTRFYRHDMPGTEG